MKVVPSGRLRRAAAEVDRAARRCRNDRRQRVGKGVSAPRSNVSSEAVTFTLPSVMMSTIFAAIVLSPFAWLSVTDGPNPVPDPEPDPHRNRIRTGTGTESAPMPKSLP